MKKLGPSARWMLTILLLGITLYRVPPQEWLPTFRHMHYGWLLAAAFFMWGIVCVNAWKWKILLQVQQLRPGYLRIFYHYAVGYFFNSFITGTGDIKRATDLGKEEQAMPQSLASVLAERWTGVIGQIGLAFITLSCAILQTPSIWPIAISSALMVLALGGLYLWVENVRSDATTSGTGLYAWIMRIRLSMSIYKSHRSTWWYCLALSFVGPLFLVIIHLCLAYALGLKPSPWALLILIPTISVFSQLPITINGFGIQDYFMVTLLENTLTSSQALALSMAFHALRLSIGASGGLLFALTPSLGLSKDKQAPQPPAPSCSVEAEQEANSR